MVAGVTGGLWVLLTLGLVVGALGVVNTLTMNVLELTRELGMLRAIGMRVVTSLVVVMLSALFPARRAASINAIEAMRQD